MFLLAVGGAGAAPLNLPPGWTASSRLAQLSPIVWAKSGSAGGETLSALAIPPAGEPADVALAQIRERLVPSNTPIWKTDATLCGAPGLVLDGRSSGPLSVTEYVVEQSHSNLYLFVYSRTSAAAADTQAEQFMRSACPASVSALPSLVPPAGWTAKTLLENIGAWQTTSGDSVIVATTSLAEAASLSSALGSATSSGAKPQTFATCSGSGIQVDQQGHLGSQSFTMTTFVMTTHESAYVIYYRHSGEVDPKVVTAIRAYCPADASTTG